MAFQNNALPFEISFFPTSVGANTLLNGGINKFKYYSLCDRYAYYPSNETNYVPSLVGSAAFDGFYQSVIPNELFNGSSSFNSSFISLLSTIIILLLLSSLLLLFYTI